MSFILIYIVNIKIYVYIKGNYIYRVFYKCYLIIIKVLWSKELEIYFISEEVDSKRLNDLFEVIFLFSGGIEN